MARELHYRHTRLVRLTHWVNALAMVILIGSGLNILAAHPALYWGQYGADADRAIAEIDAVPRPGGLTGVTRIGGWEFDTTGVLGVIDGQAQSFPSWTMIPSARDLATARNWHLFFTWVLLLNGLTYWVWSLARGHARDLVPTRHDLSPANLRQEIVDHARLRYPRGEDAKRYHALQKIAYFGTVALLIPGVVVTGLAMSPGMDSVAPWIVDLLGGRQSARTLHFVFFIAIVGFTLIHLAQVILAGPYNQLRSMITGRFDLGAPTNTAEKA